MDRIEEKLSGPVRIGYHIRLKRRKFKSQKLLVIDIEFKS